jgi:Tfp pilus assembly protein PilZ
VESNTERRRDKRFKFEADISHNILSLKIIHAGKLYNFSESGLYFESNQSLYVGEEINIWVENQPQLSEDDEQLFLGAKIIWHKELQDSPYQYGYGAKLIKNSESLMRSLNKVEFDKKLRQPSDSSDEIDARKSHRRRYNRAFIFLYQNQNYEGFITNISRGGAFIETDQKLSLGKIIVLAVPGHKNHKEIKLKGWIVRLNHKGAGVKFDLRSGRERRGDLDRRIGKDRRRRARPKSPRFS